MTDEKLHQLALALGQDGTWDSGGGCVGVMVTVGQFTQYEAGEVFFGFADGYLGWDIYRLSDGEDYFVHIGSGAAEEMTGDLDIDTLAAHCHRVIRFVAGE
jgi:hypothetical protein